MRHPRRALSDARRRYRALRRRRLRPPPRPLGPAWPFLLAPLAIGVVALLLGLFGDCGACGACNTG